MSLTVTVCQLPDGTAQVTPRGEIDVETVHLVRDAVNDLVVRQPARVALHLRDVTFIDSTGISALVAAFQTAGVSGIPLVVTEPSPNVHRILWITGLLGLFGAPQPAGAPA